MVSAVSLMIIDRTPPGLCESEIKKMTKTVSLAHGKQVYSYTCIQNGFLGKGTFGSVFLVRRLFDGVTFAFKIQDLSAMGHKEFKKQKDLCKREIKGLSAVNHPNVIRLEGHHYDKKEKKFLLILELATGGELFDDVSQNYNNKYGPGNTLFVLQQFIQIVRGVNAIHQAGWIHRDLKMENIVIAGNTLKIIDLGLSVRKDESNEERVGTPHTVDPLSVIKAGKFKWTPSADVYGLGVILYLMMHKRYPFDIKKDKNGRDRQPYEMAYYDGEYVIDRFVEAEVAVLISEMLTLDIDKRVGMDDLITRLQDFIDELDALKQKNDLDKLNNPGAKKDYDYSIMPVDRIIASNTSVLEIDDETGTVSTADEEETESQRRSLRSVEPIRRLQAAKTSLAVLRTSTHSDFKQTEVKI